MQTAVWALAVCSAVTASAQADLWQQRIDEGRAFARAGEYAKAAPLLREATDLAETASEPGVAHMVAWNALGKAYNGLARFADAEAAYRRALDAAEALHGTSSAAYALILGNLGTVFIETGQTARGERLMRESLAIHLSAPHPDERRIAAARNGLGEVLLAARKYKEAEPVLMESLAVLEKPANLGPETGIALNDLGVVRAAAGDYEQAERLFLRSLETLGRELGADHPLALRTLNNLAAVENRKGHREAAGAHLRQALEIAERRLGTGHPVYAALLGNYASYLRQGGAKSEAKRLEARSSEILKDNGRRNGIGSVVDVTAWKGK